MESGSRSKKPLLWIGVAVAALALIATSLADTDDLSEKRYSSAAADLGETPTELAMVEGAPIPVSYLCGDGGKAIVRLYVAYFDRGPDAPGLRYWSEVYQDSDLPTVAYWMSQSPEFQQRWTGVNDRDYVTGALYRNLLDRRPDKDGLDYWVQDTKKVNRDELALYWVQTPELVRKIPVNVPARCPGASDNIVTQPPVTGQPAATVRKPATTQRPATTRTPATTRRPATTRTPVTTRRPATTRKPVTTRTPATTTKPVTTTKPIAVGSGCVGNRVWKDTNRDGIHQSNEPGFNGLVVRLVNTSNKTVDQTTTKNGGYYLVCGAPGSNQIKVQIPGNYTVSPSNKGTSDWKDSDANSNGVIAVTVAKDQNVKKYDIGLITDTRRPFNQGNVSWKLIQSDDFNGTKLDDKMWEYGWFSASNGSKYDRPVAGGETACYHTDQVTLSGGELSLTMRPTTAAEDASGVCRKRDGSKAKFVSGYATTRNRYQVQPGTYIETRMYMPGQGDVVYNWPAFWTTDVDKAFGSKWPHHGEFDILEVMKGKPCSNFHYATSADGAHKQTGKRCSSIKPNRWVVIGMKWNYDGTVEYYHDGKRIQDTNGRGDWTIDPPSLAGPFAKNWSHNILLQNAMHSADRTGYKEPTANNPLTVKFDYVDVYKL